MSRPWSSAVYLAELLATMQYLILKYPDAAIFKSCPNDGRLESCVTPGVYALVAAGATMCGVTRLSVTLAVILFELTGSLDHVLPFLSLSLSQNGLQTRLSRSASTCVNMRLLYSSCTDGTRIFSRI
jgi:H+/Cl- antiporter ClcA